MWDEHNIDELFTVVDGGGFSLNTKQPLFATNPNTQTFSSMSISITVTWNTDAFSMCLVKRDSCLKDESDFIIILIRCKKIKMIKVVSDMLSNHHNLYLCVWSFRQYIHKTIWYNIYDLQLILCVLDSFM